MRRFSLSRPRLLKPRKSRCAFTMIEMLIVVTLSSGFLVLTAFWMQQTFKFSTSVKQRQREHKSLTRLAWDLRDSVRQAKTMELEGSNKLVLELQSGVATFAIVSDDSNGRVKIEKNYMAKNEAQPIKAREIFELKSNSEARWDASEMPDWVSLVVTRGAEGVAKKKPNAKNVAGTDSVFPIQLNIRVAPNRWPGSWQQAENKQ